VLLGTVIVGTSLATVLAATVPSGSALPTMGNAAKEFLRGIQGIDEAGGAGAETDEIRSILGQYNDMRNAPGYAREGGYTAALNHISSMPTTTGGAWDEVTDLPYDADDERYFDYYANTSGGSSYVTGRIQAMAASSQYVFAGGASGGLFRKPVAGGAWQLVSTPPQALSSGALTYSAGELWYATGDGSSGGTTYSGNGVWVLTNPNAASGFNWVQVEQGQATVIDGETVNTGDHLFDGSVINQLRFSSDRNWVYAATDMGVWRHSTTNLSTTKWKPVFVPHPEELPSSSTNKPLSAVDNYTSDVAIDPDNPNHVVVAYGWVIGGAANGWYEGRFANGSWSFKRSNVTGAINPKNIGRTTFAWANTDTASGRLYALVHNPDHAATGVSYSELGGVYVSTKGILGPWNKIADSQKQANSGSALDPTISGSGSINGGYQPGVQAWYNQFLAVDPAHPRHVFVGLEEVYETRDSGAKWNTVGPYWNFYFGCWGSQPDITEDEQLGCPVTTHSDQHAIAFAGGRVYVGNDGGVYSRPTNSTAYQNGHATDWRTETATSTPDVLQYYAVGVGRVDSAKVGANPVIANRKNAAAIVSGGLQDNGGSILFVDGTNPDTQMGSNFGGDGGDVLVDPNDGCRIVQEYTELSMRVTNVCAATSDINSFLDLTQATTRNIRPPEASAQFISPFAADHGNIDRWLAGGSHVWLNTKGFNIETGKDWIDLVDLGLSSAGAGRQSTSVAADHGDAIVGFCGSCSTGAFQSGYAIGKLDETDKTANHGWQIHEGNAAEVHATFADGSTGKLPTRWIAGADVYHVNGQAHYLLAFNGFGRRWVEGPGAGIGHIFESTNGTDWTELDGTGADSLPDVPTSTVKYLANGDLVAGTDLGAFYGHKSGGKYSWSRLGSGLPATVVTDLEPGPGGYLYAATYGRGIWRLQLGTGAVQQYAGGDSKQDDWWIAHKPAGSSCPCPSGNGKR
jgi:hypothetical protein